LYGPHFIKRKQFKRLKNFMSAYKNDTVFNQLILEGQIRAMLQLTEHNQLM